MDYTQFTKDVEMAVFKFMQELSCAGCKRQPLVSIYGLLYSRVDEVWQVTSYDSDDQAWTVITRGEKRIRFCPDCTPKEIGEFDAS